MSNVFLSPPVTQTISITTTLSSAQSGSLVPIALNGSANFAITLPTAQRGLYFRFFIAVDGTRDCTINGTFNGYIINDVFPLACSGKVNITIGAVPAVVGDNLEIWCDGTNWVVRGYSQNALAFF